MLPTAGDINFKDGWDTLISAIESAAGSQALFTILAVAGAVIVIVAVGGTLISKRRGGSLGQGNGKIVGAVIAGALLAAPKVVVPAALWLIDLVGNAVIQVMRNGGVSI